jgi:hypothetical protein
MDNHVHSADWRKSTHSNGSGECVEVGHSTGRIAVRDTKDHGNGPMIHITLGDWARFTASIK